LTATNTQYPVEIQNMVMVADSLMLSGGNEGAYAYGSGADTVRNSTMADFQYRSISRATRLRRETTRSSGPRTRIYLPPTP